MNCASWVAKGFLLINRQASKSSKITANYMHLYSLEDGIRATIFIIWTIWSSYIRYSPYVAIISFLSSDMASALVSVWKFFWAYLPPIKIPDSFKYNERPVQGQEEIGWSLWKEMLSGGIETSVAALWNIQLPLFYSYYGFISSDLDITITWTDVLIDSVRVLISTSAETTELKMVKWMNRVSEAVKHAGMPYMFASVEIPWVSLWRKIGILYWWPIMAAKEYDVNTHLKMFKCTGNDQSCKLTITLQVVIRTRALTHTQTFSNSVWVCDLQASSFPSQHWMPFCVSR